MALTDADRPEDERDPEDFGSREPFDETPDAGDEAMAWDDDEGATDDRGQLDLGDEEASLPWLEGDDDFEEESGGGQFALLALMAIGALALIIGGIWWFTRDRGDADLVADGSMIEAPDEPYKTKPEDPGGKTFEGTGDTSYAVSEGETRTVQLGDGENAAKPGFEAVGAGKTDETEATPPKATPTEAAATQTAEAPAPSGPGVQVGAYSSRSGAEEDWGRLSRNYEALSGVKHRVVQGKSDIGTVYRLQALPGDLAAANALCAKLKSAGRDCLVKK